MKATKRPWMVGFGHPSIKCEWSERNPGYIAIVDPNTGFALGRCAALAEDEDTAALIVRAINCHEELVEALEELLSADDVEWPNTAKKARAAIAKAKGEE